MKKILVLLMTLLLIPSIYAMSPGPDVEVSLQRYDPFPAEPGTTADIYLLVSNNRELAQDLEIEFLEEYPFRLAQGESTDKYIGNLNALQDNYAIVQYRVNIAPDAINKDYNITVFQSHSESDSRVKWEFPISIKSTDASVTLESYTFDPEEIKPGQNANLLLVLKNTGQQDVKDLDVELELDGLNLATLGSGTTQRIARLKPEETTTIDFDLILDGSAEVRIIDIPLMLNFRDLLNAQYNRSTNLGMVVKADSELSVRLDDTTIKQKDTVGDISLQVVNSGIVDVRYVTLHLLESSEYESLSYSNDVYIGNLDSDDFEIAEFKIRPKTDQPILRFELDYKDPYNTDFVKEFSLPLKIISDEELGKQQSNTGIIVGVLILVGAGIWYYRRRKKKNQMRAAAHHQGAHHAPKTHKKTKRKR